MHAPAGLPHLYVLLSATATLALLAPLVAADASADAKQAIQAGLPHYDPATYEKAQAARAAPLPVNPAARPGGASNAETAAGVLGTNPGPAAADNGVPGQTPAGQQAGTVKAASAALSEGILALPTVTVHPDTAPP